MDREDAHGVVVGLGQDGLDDARALGALQIGPVEEVSQAAALRLREGAGLVDDEPHAAPEVTRPTVGEADLEHAPLPYDPVEQLARSEPLSRVVPRGEDLQRPADGVVRRAVTREAVPGGSSGRDGRRRTCKGRRRRTRTPVSGAR